MDGPQLAMFPATTTDVTIDRICLRNNGLFPSYSFPLLSFFELFSISIQHLHRRRCVNAVFCNIANLREGKRELGRKEEEGLGIVSGVAALPSSSSQQQQLQISQVSAAATKVKKGKCGKLQHGERESEKEPPP